MICLVYLVDGNVVVPEASDPAEWELARDTVQILGTHIGVSLAVGLRREGVDVRGE